MDDESRKTAFRQSIENTINALSLENGSDTPDFILAEYLTDCLTTFDKITKIRDKWYGFKTLSETLGDQ